MCKSRFFSIAALLIAVSFCAAAQPGTPSYTLDSVAVTGSKIPLSLGQSARIVTVMDSVRIAAMPAMSVNDLLKFAVAVDVRQRGVMGMQTDISMRGGTHDQIAILLNGINISDPQTGHNAADFPVDISQIERIEILEGPAARAYGTSSLLGAVNIVTKSFEESGVTARVEGGSYGLLNAGLSGHIVKNGFSNNLSASYLRSDGYNKTKAGTPNTDISAAKLFYQGAYSSDSFSLGWHAGASLRDFGSNTFYSPKFDDQFEHTFKSFTALQLETYTKLHIKSSVYWNHSQDRFELFRGQKDKYPYNYHRVNVAGVNLGGWFETSIGKTAFGAEVRNENIISTNLGEPLSSPIPVTGADAEYRVGLNRTDMNFYLEHNVILRRFTFSAGVVAAKNTGNNDRLRLYPGVDASVRISDSWKLYASYNSSLRMPTFTELYYSVGGHQADKNLKAERMQAVEFGVKYMKAGIRAIASVYYHKGTNLIDWIKDNSVPDAPWTSVNHAELNSLGEEITLHIEPGVIAGNEYFPIRDIDISYSHIDQSKAPLEGYESYYALEYLRNKAVIQADFILLKKLNLNISYRWHDRVGSYRLYEDGADTGKTVTFSPYSLLDAKISYPFGNFRAYLSAENLLNCRYFDHGNVPQPGIWIKGGLSFTFFK
ncbi:MAG: TonB-dependent receptor [Bacteroidales bacterium]|nr:TonB-dependent receptor [Bacteroidales bacterium]